MPIILRIRGFRFFFFSREGNEPPYIHVENAEKVAKFWLNPVELARSYGFRSHELNELHQMVEEHRDLFEEKWHEYFGSEG